MIDPLKPIFLGYTLANSQHQILFMEEWDYIRDNQVALIPYSNLLHHIRPPPLQITPKYEKAIHEFQKQSTENEDFVRLYVPMRRNLIRSFENILAVR